MWRNKRCTLLFSAYDFKRYLCQYFPNDIDNNYLKSSKPYISKPWHLQFFVPCHINNQNTFKSSIYIHFLLLTFSALTFTIIKNCKTWNFGDNKNKTSFSTLFDCYQRSSTQENPGSSTQPPLKDSLSIFAIPLLLLIDSFLDFFVMFVICIYLFI